MCDRLRLLLCLAVLCGSPNSYASSPANERQAAIHRALVFLDTFASDDRHFDAFGSDLLWCFYSISHTARDHELRTSADDMGRKLAKRWHDSHRHVPSHAAPQDIYILVMGAYAADRLGFPDHRLKAELRRAARRFTAKDFLGFDALHESPRPDDPARYDVWSGALITTFFGDAYDVRLGAHYRDVLQWLPQFRPYQGSDEDLEFDSFYAVTHVIYTLNRYHERRIARSLLPDEFTFLQHKLDEAVEDDDPEMVGESLDCLKAAGFEDDPQVRKGIDYLVSHQRSDGTWAGDQDDPYTEYHAAWTAIDGLRDYRYRGRVTKLPGK